MASSEREPTAVIVVRAWREEGPSVPFRARVTWTLDVSLRREETVVVSSIEETTTQVRRCLEEFFSGSV